MMKKNNVNKFLMTLAVLLVLSGVGTAVTTIRDGAVSEFFGISTGDISANNIKLTQNDESIIISPTYKGNINITTNTVGLLLNAFNSTGRPAIKWRDSEGEVMGEIHCHINATDGSEHKHCKFYVLNEAENGVDWIQSWEFGNTSAGMGPGILFNKNYFVDFEGNTLLGVNGLKSDSSPLMIYNHTDFNDKTVYGVSDIGVSNTGGRWSFFSTSIVARQEVDVGGYRIKNTRNVQIVPRSSETCDLTNEGTIYYDSDDNNFYGCNSTNWRALS